MRLSTRNKESAELKSQLPYGTGQMDLMTIKQNLLCRLWRHCVEGARALWEKSYKMRPRPRGLGDKIQLKGLPGLWELNSKLKGDSDWSGLPASSQKMTMLEIMIAGDYQCEQSNGTVWCVKFKRSQIVREL